MTFQRPELLLLALPVALAWWRLRDPRRGVNALRLAAWVALALVLARPLAVRSAPGRDLVVVVDRSASMPPRAEERALEIVRLAEEARGEGDRVAVVGFGGQAVIERLPSETLRFDGFRRDVQRHGSDLGAAVETALALIPPERPGGVLVVSDGESNGRDAVVAARRAFARGVAIDTLALARPAESDLSVERIDLPDEVAVGEPFQFTAWVRSDRRVAARFRVERSGETIVTGERVFERGLSRLLLRDVVPTGGVADVRVLLEPVDGVRDRVPENDAGLAALRVAGARPVLVVNDDGAEGALVRALHAARIPALARSPETAPLDRVSLTAFRAVVLENVEAGRVGVEGMRALSAFVTERGGGLLLTGGRAGFGVGGYHLSPIDPLLPVSMEMRQEARKQSIALAIAMDRSGSMGAPAGGLTKMDLANLGASAAIELLSPMDAVAVIAVDSAPHVVQELVPVDDPTALVRTVRGIQAGGGGIFTYTALYAAAAELDRAEQTTRHVILFADAADSEEQERVPALLAQLRRMGVSVSVIALGTEGDVDAGFLKATAQQGGGQAWFTTDPTELPRLFAQDTMMVARSTFVEEPTGVDTLPDLFGLGAVPPGFPDLAGYNLTYLRPDGVAGAVTTDDYRAPVFAFGYRGIGRTAVYTGQVGGRSGAALVAWEGFATFFVTAVRWLVGQEEPAGYFPTVRRDGQRAVVGVEVDRAAGVEVGPAGLTARVERPDGSVAELVLERVGPDRWEASTDLVEAGVALGTLRLEDGRFVELPPVALPYSPEFERGTDPDAGERLLRAVARESGGTPLAVTGDFFAGDDAGRALRPLARELLAVAIALLVLEIAVRRLALFESLRAPRPVRIALRRLRERFRRRAAVRAVPAPALAGTRAPGSGEEARPELTAPPPRPAAESMADALARARSQARRRTDR